MAAIRATLPHGTPIELWWQDEARVGQKNGITRRWARRGTRPSAPKDQRTASAYIYGAICPAEGKGAALVLPRCNTQGMTLHLAEISAAIAPGAHAILLLDQAGWHGSEALVVPANITLLLLPSKCPELNHVHRTAPLGTWVMLNGTWYNHSMSSAIGRKGCGRAGSPPPERIEERRRGAPSRGREVSVICCAAAFRLATFFLQICRQSSSSLDQPPQPSPGDAQL